MNICYNINESFDFSALSLGTPKSLQGGAYFSKVKINNKPQFIFQTPKCKTKSGIIKTEKKTYCDLMFINDDDVFLKWLEQLEKTIQNLIHEKQDSWFHNEMDLEDIEDFYHPTIRIYQGDKYLVRSSINQPRYIQRSVPLQIYDENENELTLDDIDNNKKIICILEVLGIKFTTTSIRTELCLRQIMTLDNSPVFAKCLIHLPREQKNNPTTVEQNSLLVNPTIIKNEQKKPKNVSFTNDENKTDKQDCDDKEESENILKDTDKATDFIMTDRGNNGTAKDLAKKDISDEQPQENTSNDDDIKKEIHNDVKNNINQKMKESLTTENLDENVEKKETVNTQEPLEKNILQEVNLAVSQDETITLKKPDEVYYEIYAEAKRRAKIAKQKAIEAFLEAKRIKNLYLLNEIDNSDDSDNDSLTEIEENL